ncbi:MAG: hypothetical protein NT159_07660 [Proteobacteria bacterium]|nr:hypothetical protein [Pseudomonadota bacterium]
MGNPTPFADPERPQARPNPTGQVYVRLSREIDEGHSPGGPQNRTVGLYQPGHDLYQLASGDSCFIEGHAKPDVLLTRIDRFHNPEDIVQQLRAWQSRDLVVHPYAAMPFIEDGEGLNIRDRTGFHTMASSYLLVRRSDVVDWLGFAHAKRGLHWRALEGVHYSIQEIVIWVKPTLPEQQTLYGLVGASVGHVLGAEVSRLSRHLFGTTGRITRSLVCQRIKNEYEKFGVGQLAQEFALAGRYTELEFAEANCRCLVADPHPVILSG